MKYLFPFLLLVYTAYAYAIEHPSIYARNSERSKVHQTIKEEQWASEIFHRLVNEIEPYADHHAKNPDWILSRMAMYWHKGERYTQCYMKDQNWERGEGNAPVPTVRMPGMRTWNKYKNVPLADRIPYNETGDMLGLSITDPSLPPVLVPYKESGHMVRANNVEILTIGELAAVLYWLTNEEKYARLSADIFYQWLLGTYYMNPILDPEKSCGSAGGWEAGGICGYYDYEQIHDDLALHTAVTYDFLYDYLKCHPHKHLKKLHQSLEQVTGTVLKRFIDLGMIRGGKSGNWNVNGWNMMLPPVLALEDDDFYVDGHGRSYYLNYLTRKSTPYHDAIPDIVKSYDPVTGLWPESPGYSFGTIAMLLDFAALLSRQGIDIFEQNPILEKAASAVFPWMDARGNMIVFGDSRGGVANFTTFERLLTYYNGKGVKPAVQKIAAAIMTGIDNGSYSRNNGSWESLFLNTPFPQKGSTSKTLKREAASFSPFHRLTTLKDDNLMAVVYGGRDGSHLSPNGLAMQLYGFGYALAPDAAGYESYWSADYAYHQSATGSNTILPGYMEGEIIVNAMWPKIPEGNFTADVRMTTEGRHDDGHNGVRMVDISANEKRRVVAIVPKRNAKGGGYYIDIFRSDLSDNHYIYHNVGRGLEMFDSEAQALPMKSVEKLDTTFHKGYEWFANPRVPADGKVKKIVWNVTDSIQMTMYPSSVESRTLYAIDAPYSTITSGITPEDVSMPPNITPTLIISQRGQNAATRPFVSVFEPSVPEQEYITSVTELFCERDSVVVRIDFIDGTHDIVRSGAVGVFSIEQPEHNTCWTGRWGDQGDGTFRNPIIAADYSDPDPLRVGDDYYMVASTFESHPGVSILHSKDLVNWTTIGAALTDLKGVDKAYSTEQMSRYNGGVYAPTISYHDGTYYVYVNLYTDGFYVATTKDPRGPWESQFVKDKYGRPLRVTRWSDPCPFWDDDGKAYLVASHPGTKFWYSYIFQMSPDGTMLLDADSAHINQKNLLYEYPDGGTVISPYHSSEGNRVFKRNGYYYLQHIEFTNKGQGEGTYIFRSRNLYGTLDDGTPGGPGNPGKYEVFTVEKVSDREHLSLPGQGGYVTTPDGHWWWIGQFTKDYPCGRAPHLLPVTWVNDWPVIGNLYGTQGQMVWQMEKPILGCDIAYSQGRDDFSSNQLHPQWIWNHEPDSAQWSLSVRPGFLRVYARKPVNRGGFFNTSGTLCQRYMMSNESQAAVTFDTSGMAVGGRAGIAHFNGGKNYAFVAIEKLEDGWQIVSEINGDIVETKPLGKNIKKNLSLKTSMLFNGEARFYYSLDGKSFFPIGNPYQMSSGNFRGDMIGIFTYNDNKDAGYIDIDKFEYDF